MLKRPQTPQAYVELVKQAVFEVEELRASIEFDMEGMDGANLIIDELERHVKGIYNAMRDGNYEFQNKELPYMELLRRHESVFLPFKELLNLINETHRNGLQVET